MPGDKLKIEMTKISDPPEESHGKRVGRNDYAVKRGRHSLGIAKKLNLTFSDIKTWNHLNEADRIHPEDRLKWKVGGIKSSTLN